MLKLISTFILVVAANPNAHAQAKSIGEGGQVELVTGMNNRALTFGSEAEEWKKKYPIDKIKSDPKKGPSEDGIAFCLGGLRDGANILNRGNDISLAYEDYMRAPANNNPGLASAYGNQEKNLHGLNDELKKRSAAAKCK